MDTRFWQERLDRCPAMRPWLARAARTALRREAMPASLTLGEVPADRTVRQALEALFGPCREIQGRLVAALDDGLRTRGHWLPLATLLGLEPAGPGAAKDRTEARTERALQRLKVLHPGDLEFIGQLRDTEALHRFCAASDAAERELAALFDALARLRQTPGGITLSELGAQCLNDSKALRTGRLRQALELLLRVRSDAADAPDRNVLAEAGVIDNPYTTHAVVHAPFAYRPRSGSAWEDWPFRLWRQGEAAVLSWETVRRIGAVRFEEPCAGLVTSENAAPFLRLVEGRVPGVYTEGYPNAAVKTLLARFAEAGATAAHWGDTDLDGYRIAEQVGQCLPTRLHPLPANLPPGRFRPLTPEQRVRTERYVAAHPDFPFRDELRLTLTRGWLEQEHGAMPCR